ncbi:MAG: bifunctional folylpolyglutamate synthase/dihydrofolate synthase [Acidimicrobiales bacterium]
MSVKGWSPGQALRWLEDHYSAEADPRPAAAVRRLDRVQGTLGLLGDPQVSYPVIHVTGTNGKGSTCRMISALLAANGLSVGTFTSPHLDRVNERITWGGEPIEDAELAEVLAAVALAEEHLGVRSTWFEVLTAAAFRWFADVAVDLAVVEVGLGGRHDATNTADGQVTVITNVAMDHAELIGPTRADIATEKAGIIKAGARVIQGQDDPELETLLRAAAREAGAGDPLVAGRDFGGRGYPPDWSGLLDRVATGTRSNRSSSAFGGHRADLFTPTGAYADVMLGPAGAYQVANAATALVSAEAFLDVALAPEVVRLALGGVRVPGRMDLVGGRPPVILDGAHNPAGGLAARSALDELVEAPIVLVVGLLGGRDPAEMLMALGADRVRAVVACAPPSPRARPAAEVAAAAASLGAASQACSSVEKALEQAQTMAGEDGVVWVAGSLYLVAEARRILADAGGF